MWQNLVVHITLPKGLKLTNGQVLLQPITLSVTSGISPYYCSIDQVRLHGGTYLQKLGDLAIASEVYEISKSADGLTYREVYLPPNPTNPYEPATRIYNRFVDARQKWVIARATRELILNVWDMSGARGSHTLGNFSVQRQSVMRDEGLPKKLQELQDQENGYRLTLQSGGHTGFKGHVVGGMTPRGAFGPDAPAGREWITTGMGANRKTLPGFGSYGKPVKYGLSLNTRWLGGYGMGAEPWFSCSPPLYQFRTGAYMGMYTAVFTPGVAF